MPVQHHYKATELKGGPGRMLKDGGRLRRAWSDLRAPPHGLLSPCHLLKVFFSLGSIQIKVVRLLGLLFPRSSEVLNSVGGSPSSKMLALPNELFAHLKIHTCRLRRLNR